MGRVKTYEAIVKGQNVPQSGVPESFKVLVKELQSLGLDIKVLDKEKNEIDLKQTFDDDEDMPPAPSKEMKEEFDEAFSYVKDEGEMNTDYFFQDEEGNVIEDTDDAVEE